MSATLPGAPSSHENAAPDVAGVTPATSQASRGLRAATAEIEALWKSGARSDAAERARLLFEGQANNPSAVLFYADFCFAVLRDRVLATAILEERLASLPHQGIFLRLAHYQARTAREDETLSLASKYFSHPQLCGFAYACYGAALLRQTGDLDTSVGFFHQASRLLGRDKRRDPAAMAMSPKCFLHCSEFSAQDGYGGLMFLRESQLRPQLVVCATGDEIYFRAFNKIYRETFFRHNQANDSVLHFHIFDPSEELAAEIAREDGTQSEPVSYSFERTGQRNKSYYYAGRFVQAVRLLEHYDCPIIVTDIDCLFKGGVDLVADAIKGADMGIIDRAHVLFPWQRFRAGLAAFAPTKSGMLYASALRGFLLQAPPERLNYVWIDQLGLAECAYVSRNLGIGNIASVTEAYARVCHQQFYRHHGYPEEKARMAHEVLSGWQRSGPQQTSNADDG